MTTDSLNGTEQAPPSKDDLVLDLPFHLEPSKSFENSAPKFPHPVASRPLSSSMSTTFESTRNSSAHHHGSATTTTTSQSLNKLNQTSTVHSSTLLLLLKNQYINTKERQQWESYFDPQYTFESRTAEKHSSKKPDPSYLYTPQETQQTLQTLPGQKVPGTSVHLFDSSSYQSNTSMFSYVSSPILPDIDKLKVHGTAHTSAHAQSTTDQIEIVPSPSTFIKPRDRRQNTLDEKKQIHRIELLNSIRQEGLLDENDTVRHPKGMSKTEKWQRRFKERAEEWKHQVVSMDDSLKGKGPKFKGLLPCRVSFLLFLLGFLCPLFWLLGALRTPTRPTAQTSHGKRTDRMWKYRCRNALIVFFLVAAVLSFLTIIFKPDTVGWRKSRQDKVVSGGILSS